MGKAKKEAQGPCDGEMKTRTIVLTVAAIISLALLGYLIAATYLPSEPVRFRQAVRVPDLAELHAYFTMRIVVGTVNAGLLIILLILYVGVYLRTHAEFSIGLSIFATTLLLYAIMSGPLVLSFSGPVRIYGLGPFAALPELFTTFAVAVLLYLSLK